MPAASIKVQESGFHAVQFDDPHFSGGVCFCRLTAIDFVQRRRLVVLR
jgi:hypothetical protein